MSQPKQTYWREPDAKRVLAALDASGMSTAAFARRHGLNPARLHRWRARLQPPQPAPDFLPVHVATAAQTVAAARTAARATADIELLIGDGVRVRVPRDFCGETLMRLLDVLGGVGSC